MHSKHHIKVLKQGCYFITTVRTEFYQSTKEKWAEEISKSGSNLVEETSMPYYYDDENATVVMCAMLVIQKNADE